MRWFSTDWATQNPRKHNYPRLGSSATCKMTVYLDATMLAMFSENLSENGMERYLP